MPNSPSDTGAATSADTGLYTRLGPPVGSQLNWMPCAAAGGWTSGSTSPTTPSASDARAIALRERREAADAKALAKALGKKAPKKP